MDLNRNLWTRISVASGIAALCCENTLTPSNDLLIIRTHKGADPLPLLKVTVTGEHTALKIVDHFPEASISIFRILDPRPRPIRDRIKQEVRAQKH